MLQLNFDTLILLTSEIGFPDFYNKSVKVHIISIFFWWNRKK